MTSTLIFNTFKATGVTAEGKDPYWIGKAVHRPTVNRAQIARRIAAERNVPVEDVLYLYRRTDELIRDMLAEGHNVNMESVGYSINLTGSFGSKDAPFDPNGNALEVSAYAKPIMRDCLKGRLTPRNATGGLKANIGSVTDDSAFLLNTITVPSRVLVVGMDILVTLGAADEGVWLFDRKGTLAATPEITANTVSTIDLDFGELPPDGEYTLVVKARSGASADYAPATARKAVTVARG